MNQRNQTLNHNPLKAAALALVAGTALLVGPSAFGADNQSRSSTVTSDGQNTVRVEATNETYTITLNGKEIKSGSLSEAWKTFDLVDEDGESIGTVTRDGSNFTVTLDDVVAFPAPGLAEDSRVRVRQAMAEREAGQRARVARAYSILGSPEATNEPRPKTMLGVTLENPSEAVCAHLGINRENATMLTSVTDDLPAGKAGLKQYDVITEINGEPAPPDAVRRLLREKNAGDTLAVKAVRAGERKEFTITLEAYDPSRLNTMAFSTAGSAWSPGVQIERYNPAGSQAEFEARAKAMEQLAQQMREKADAFGNSDGKAIEELHAQMRKLAAEMEKRAEELGSLNPPAGWNWQGGGQGGVIIGRRGSGGSAPLVFPLPAAPTPPSAPIPPSAGFAAPGGDLAALQARLDRTDERLAKLTELLEKAVREKGASAGGSGAKDR